jgi:hypothetical protein
MPAVQRVPVDTLLPVFFTKPIPIPPACSLGETCSISIASIAGACERDSPTGTLLGAGSLNVLLAPAQSHRGQDSGSGGVDDESPHFTWFCSSPERRSVLLGVQSVVPPKPGVTRVHRSIASLLPQHTCVQGLAADCRRILLCQGELPFLLVKRIAGFRVCRPS